MTDKTILKMPNRHRVILIHGLHQTPLIMRPLAKRLQAQGYKTYEYGYPSVRDDIATHSARLNNWLERHHDPNQPLHLVGHSLGGLIIREFISRYPAWQIDRCVTLGTPHLGSICAAYLWQWCPALIGQAYQDALDGTAAPLSVDGTHDNTLNDDPKHERGIALGVIAGNRSRGIIPGLGQPILSYHNRQIRRSNHTHNHRRRIGRLASHHVTDEQLNDSHCAHDGTVYVAETHLPSACDHIILPVTHTGMLIDSSVAAQTSYFLAHGTFDHDALSNQTKSNQISGAR